VNGLSKPIYLEEFAAENMEEDAVGWPKWT